MKKLSQKTIAIATILMLLISLVLPAQSIKAETPGYRGVLDLSSLENYPDLNAKFTYINSDIDPGWGELDALNGVELAHGNRGTGVNMTVNLKEYNEDEYEFLGWAINNRDPVLNSQSVEGIGLTSKTSYGIDGAFLYIGISSEYGYEGVSTFSYDVNGQFYDELAGVDITLVPVFEAKSKEFVKYSLTVEESETGNVSIQPLTGNDYILKATPNFSNTHHFVGWKKQGEENIFSTENELTITIQEDTTLIALFDTNSATLELTDDAFIFVKTSIESFNFNTSLAKNITPLFEGQRVNLHFPYKIQGTGSVSVPYNIKVYEGTSTSGQLLAEYSDLDYNVRLTLYPSEKDDYASVTIDPLPASGTVTVEMTVNGEEPLIKTYQTEVQSAEEKGLVYLTTPSAPYDISTEDTGPDILDVLSFVDEETGRLDVYAAAFGGVLKLNGTNFEFIKGLDFTSAVDSAMGRVLALGGTKEKLIAVVANHTEIAEYITIYEYTVATNTWKELDNAFLDAQKEGKTYNALVVDNDNIWTDYHHWDGTEWTKHDYKFSQFVNSRNGHYFASTADRKAYQYKAKSKSWREIQLGGSPDIINIKQDGTIAFSSENGIGTRDVSGNIVQAPLSNQVNTGNSWSNHYYNIDRNGDSYLFENSHWYGKVRTTGALGHSIYKFNAQENKWNYQYVPAFYAQNEYTVGTSNYLNKKVRPTTVQKIYNLTDNASVYAGRGGAIYADFEEKTITFNSNGGSEVAPITAEINSAINAPVAPAKAEEHFVGWYLDKELTKAYSFDYMPAKNIELFAKWGDQPVDLTQAKATANQTIEDAYKKYNKRDYDEEGWSALTQAKEDGLAAIESEIGSEDAVKTAMNVALGAMASIPLSENITVAVSMEKFTLGQGYIIEPTLVTVPRNTKASKVITDLIVQKYGATPRPYEMTGNVENSFYLSHVKDGDHDYNIPQYILDAIEASGQDFTLENDDWLGEFDFYYMSGWMYAINNVFPGVGAAGWTLQNDQVMRWQYTLYGYGADLNADNSEWGSSSIVKTAQKDNLTWRVAEINAMEASEKAKYKADYDKALVILQNMESTQEEVDGVLKALGGTERKGVEVTAEMPEEAKVVEIAIQALPLAIKLSDKEAVEEARAAYDALSPTMQQWIWKDTLVLLTNAEGKIATLEQQVADRIEQIAALPAADALTLADEAALKDAKNEFSTLSDEQKALVTNAAILTTLTTKLDVLKGLEESKPTEETKPAEKTSVETVMDLINVLPKEATLKLTDEAKITAAKTAYDALSKEQQKQVTNYDKLAGVLTKLNTLKAADKVMKAIDDLPTVSSLKVKDEDELEDVRKLYDALTKEQKALVKNLDELKDLETQMKKLKSSSTTSSGGSGGSGGSKATTTAKPATETPVQTTNTPAASNYKVEKAATSLNVTFTQAQMNELAASQNETVTINAGAAISVEIPKAVFTENLSKDAELSVAVTKENDTLQVKLLEVLANGMKRELTLPSTYVKVKFPLTLFTAGPTASLSPIAQDSTGVILRVVDGEYKAVPHQIDNGEVSIYANSNDEYVYSTKTITFDDIAKLANKDDIEFLASRYVVNGTSDTTFEPNKSITRAQFGAMIARALNLVPTEDTHYADTKGKWYEADIQALYEAGITNAPGDFNPGATLSREHAAVFMYRVMEYIQKDNTLKATAVAYADQAEINASYAEAIATLNALQIMQGKDGNVFDAKGHLTRAQMAKVLRKTLEAIDMM